jgi:hypothetical protein
MVGVASFLLVASIPSVHALPIGGGGKRGPSQIYGATCKYGLAPYPGHLRLWMQPPLVAGAPRRRGREWVRYAAWLVNPYGQTVQVSNWSDFIRASDGVWATWSGQTFFEADWRGNYRIEIRIEWWNRYRRIGWQAHRITDYYYIDEWGTSWGGPFPSCMRQPV